MQRLHAGATLAVAVDCRDLVGKAGQVGDRVGPDTGEFAGAADIAEGNVLDQPGRNLRIAFEERPYYLGARFVETGGYKTTAAATAECRADTINDDCVLKFHALPQS